MDLERLTRENAELKDALKWARVSVQERVNREVELNAQVDELKNQLEQALDALQHLAGLFEGLHRNASEWGDYQVAKNVLVKAGRKP